MIISVSTVKLTLIIIAIALVTVLASCSENSIKETSVTKKSTVPGSSVNSARTQDTTINSTTQKAFSIPTTQDSQTGKEKAAVSDISKSSPENIKKAEALYLQGFQTYMSWKLDDAIRLFDQAINTDPGCYKAYNGKGIVLCFKGDYKNGMALIDKALDMKSDYVYANFNKALGYKIQKDFDNAMLWFNKALSLDPSDTWSYYGIACIYAEKKDAKNAVIYLKKAIDIDPTIKDSAKKEHDLYPVRNDPSFIELLK